MSVLSQQSKVRAPGPLRHGYIRQWRDADRSFARYIGTVANSSPDDRVGSDKTFRP